MEYRRLGGTGLKVSELCLGCMTFGRETDEKTAGKILDRFIEVGGNFLDTANVYAAGASEEILGRILGERRKDLIVATKVRFNANIFIGKSVGPNQIGLSRGHIMSEVEASLRRLKMDYIDLYQVHSWDFETPIEETVRIQNVDQRNAQQLERCKRFMMLFELDMFTTSGCRPVGLGNVSYPISITFSLHRSCGSLVHAMQSTCPYAPCYMFTI